jgi:acyl-CoA synthetase (AMP-forming)/AMP-acid ligase II
MEQEPEFVWASPATIGLTIARSKQAFPPSVKAIISCTAPLDGTLAAQAEQVLGVKVLQSYGLSETLISTIESSERDLVREFSCGLSISGAEALIVDSEGQIVIRNGAVMPGYASLDSEMSHIVLTMPDGYVSRESFRSGDIGTLEEGRLVMTGRVSNVINVDGVKLSPEKMEEALRELPGIEFVCIARVSVRQEKERPVVLVKHEDGFDLDRIYEVCVSRFGTKSRPAQVFSVTEIPLTANGKIDRKKSDSAAHQLMIGTKL